MFKLRPNLRSTSYAAAKNNYYAVHRLVFSERPSCLLSGGTYVAVLAKGDSQEKAFGYAYAAIAAAALKAGLVNAGEVGMGKAPFFVWGAIASYIAYKALDE